MTRTTYDLVIANATRPQGAHIDVGVRDGRIATIAESGELAGVSTENSIDASGLLLLPGVIDPHTHLNFPFDDDDAKILAQETIAAAAGGITTVGNYPLGIGGDILEHLAVTQESIQSGSNVDVALSYPILTNDQVSSIPDLHRAGITSYKILRAYRPPDVYEFGGVDDALLYRAMEEVASLNRDGRRALLKLHCENVEIFKVFKDRYQEQYPNLGRDEPLSEVTWAHCRPSVIEAESVNSALFLAEHLDCPIMIVHLSSGMSLEPIRIAKQRGVDVLVETTPLYLETDAYSTGSENGPHWTRVQPSVKFKEDSEALWHAVANRTVDLLGTDHAATRKEAYAGKSVWDHGASGRSLLAIFLPLMLDAASRGRMTLSRLEEVMCHVPALAMGISGKKGRLAIGLDADFVLCDLDEEREVTPDVLHSRADHTCFEGRRLRGWPVYTVLRGDVIWSGDTLQVANAGQFVPGGDS